MRLKVIEAPKRPCGGVAHYPWRDLEVGQMFEVRRTKQSTISANAFATGKRLGRKFSCRKRKGTKDRFVVRRVK